jgi:hypothetical protein
MGIVLTGEGKRDSAEKHTLESLNRFLSVIGHQDDRAIGVIAGRIYRGYLGAPSAGLLSEM